MAHELFWLFVLMAVYTYVGYPLILALLTRSKTRPVKKDTITPKVSVIVAAYNEEAHLQDKLNRLLSQDYTQGLLEIIVASDGSTDGTDQIVESNRERGVLLCRVEGRKGKTAAQNHAVRMASGDILVFTDATTDIVEDGIRQIVQSFADPQVGCVGGHLVYVSREKSDVGRGGAGYWSYEKNLKRMEAAIGSLIGVSGCFYAVRRDIYEDIREHLISDFVVALGCVERGYRVAYEERAISYEETLENPDKEFSMRVRVAVRSYGALWEKRVLMNPFKYGMFAWQLLSHKLLRYSMPLFMLGTFVSNAFILDQWFYALAFAAQSGVYLLASVVQLTGAKSAGGLLSKPYYLVLVNAAVLVALVKFLMGSRMITWTPVR